jgi:hypothetical protein
MGPAGFEPFYKVGPVTFIDSMKEKYPSIIGI